tara:strand:- start:179 stop:415 length:237 start_codon:yes stop_codon:yes gene_type:complete
LSADKGDLLKLNFLRIENKFSKQGYQSNNTIKKGDNCGLFKYKFIKIIENIKPKIYEPESPKNIFDLKFKKIKTISEK